MTQAFKNFILIVIIFIFASPEVFAQKESSINVTEVSTKKKYGKTPKTAIEVGTVGNEYDYLDQLCGPNGERIKYERIESCCAFKCPSCDMGEGLLDKWEIQYVGSEEPLILYLNGYVYGEPKAPKGLGIKLQN